MTLKRIDLEYYERVTCARCGYWRTCERTDPINMGRNWRNKLCRLEVDELLDIYQQAHNAVIREIIDSVPQIVDDYSLEVIRLKEDYWAKSEESAFLDNEEIGLIHETASLNIIEALKQKYGGE